MKHLKLFFALFAMLALGAGNAWGAEVTYTFNTDAGIAELGVTKPSAGAGTDLDADKSYVLGDVSMKVTHATTKTRVYNSSGNVDLRIYKNGGTLTFSVPSGSISKVVFAGTTTNVFTANVGTWSNSTWTGDAASVTFTATATGKINTITVTYETASGENPGEGGGENPDSGEETSATMTAGTNGSACTVNGKDGIKVGSSSKGGDMQITVPAGATMLHVYAAAWNGVSGLSLNITPTSNVTTTSIALKANTGIASSTPFTLSGDEADYLFDIPLQNITAETILTFTSSIAKRFVVWGATYETSGSGSTEPVVSVPTFSVPEGTFYSPINVELSCETADAEIYYTLDGTTPSSTSEKYTTAIAISETTTVKAIAVKDGLTDSEVATATYTKGETVTSYDIDFETNALEAYVNWDFSNITIASTAITAKEGTYYGNTSGKSTNVYIKTKEEIQYPGTLTFYTSKESGNTTSSSWLVQVSENGTDWTDVSSFSAITGDKGDWTERTTDLSDYENVYVQITYTGSTAVRAIDEISLAQGVAPVKYALTITTPENGSLSITNGVEPVTSGDEFKEGTELNVTATPNSGYKGGTILVKDASDVDVTSAVYADGVLTMPAYAITISATFEVNEKPDATLTLSINGNTDTKINGKQDDEVTLPSITNDCVKEFVGWSANSTCNVAPEYKAGDSYTLASTTQTLYAVYADAEAGENVTQTLTISGQTTATTYANKSFTDNKGQTWSGQCNIPDASHFGLRANDDNTHIASPVFSGNVKSVKAIIRNSSSSTRKVYLCSSNTTAKPSSGDLGGVTVNGSVTDVEHTFTISGAFNQFYMYTSGALQFNKIEVTYGSAPTYSNYSTTCAAAPIATVNPTSVTATAASAEGKVTVTYENVNTASVSVALYNDDACTEAFSADWLTASLDGDKNITYTVAENTTYAERKAYIQLTAPETTGATDPDVVVIPVTQAAKEKVFASLAELVAADLTAGDEVTVTLNNDVIKDFYIYSSKRCGVVFDVQKDGKDIKIYFNSQTTIDDWAVGGKLSGTLTNVKWTTYSSAWQLAPDYNTWAWANLTYTEPKAVSTVVVSGAPTKTTYVDGEAFDPAGLTVTVNYNDATSEVNPTGVTFTVTPTTLVKGQTSVSVTATYNTVSSAPYEVTGLTVNDIPTKTVAEFIAAGGTRCYLEGIVSNITNATYGNFDLTDASGKIYVYGCLNAAGEEQKFAELGVKNGDKIKVIADEYELYGGTKDEAKNVQYVSHISAATITIADITMEVDGVATINATVDPADAVVTYTIKENEANAISLSGKTITALAEGIATITATVAEGATYLGNSVDFTVTVGPKSEKVVILAEREGQWYALKAEYLSGKTDRLVAVPVDYFNGTLYNVAEEIKETIEWNSIVEGDKVSFLNDGKYLKGKSSTTLLFEAGEDGLYQWDNTTYTMTIGTSVRSFLYNGEAFRNFAISNAGQTKDGITYSSLPVVTAPVYATGTPVYTRTIASGDYGTICLPYASSSYSGAEFYEISWMELDEDGITPKSIWLDQVNGDLVAGKPYIFKATSIVLTVNCTGSAVANPAAGEAGLVGTFKLIQDSETSDDPSNTLEGNYMISGNKFLLCPAGCWLNANRAYIDATIIAGHTTKKAEIPGRRRVCLGETSENEATGFENIVAPEGQAVKAIVNGQLIIIRDGVKYNVQGQKL